MWDGGEFDLDLSPALALCEPIACYRPATVVDILVSLSNGEVVTGVNSAAPHLLGEATSCGSYGVPLSIEQPTTGFHTITAQIDINHKEFV